MRTMLSVISSSTRSMSELKVNMKNWIKIHAMGRNLDQVYLSQETIQEGYSLLQFEKTKSIFVHVPKAAGVSINKGIYGNLGAGHKTMQQYNRIFGKKALESYFKYTIVRHPVSRLYSAFQFLKTGGFNDADRLWADRYLSRFESFDDFVLNWLCEENIWKGMHFKPQWHFVCDPFPEVAVDYVGKFETLDEDLICILEKIGFSDVQINHENKSVKSDDRFENFTPETIKKVEEIYCRDFKLFGYARSTP